MHRFFVNKDQIFDNEIKIEGTDVKHIRSVLRLKLNDKIEISCNDYDYLCEISDINKDHIIAEILEKNKGNSESSVDITLYQGLSKGNKMELIFQKGTEIGIKEFVPVATHRSVVKINDIKKEQNKVERWNTIVEEAAKQSKRNLIPHVKNIINFNEMIDVLRNQENIIVPYEDEKALTIKEGLLGLSSRKINIVIGPEGGFESEEIQKLRDIGAKIVTLGPRILRTETAGIVTSTIVLYEVGNIGVI
jgi:16S rRNA (uracil1498-N3)-methyltransferase